MSLAPQRTRITREDMANPERAARALSPVLTDVAGALNSRLSLRNVPSLDKTIRVTMPERWLSPGVLSGGWVKPNPAYASVGYWKDASGRVYLRGVLSGGTYSNSEPIFTLPSGFAPAKYALFSAAQSSVFEGAGVIEVRSDGGVYAPIVTSVQSGTSTYISLDGISFEAADLTPQDPGNPFPILLSTGGLPPGQRIVSVASCVDTTTGVAGATLPSVRWDVATFSGVPYVRLLDLVGLQPSRAYEIRVIVLGL